MGLWICPLLTKGGADEEVMNMLPSLQGRDEGEVLNMFPSLLRRGWGGFNRLPKPLLIPPLSKGRRIGLMRE